MRHNTAIISRVCTTYYLVCVLLPPTSYLAISSVCTYYATTSYLAISSVCTTYYLVPRHYLVCVLLTTSYLATT